MRTLIFTFISLFLAACLPSRNEHSDAIDTLEQPEQNYYILKNPQSFAVRDGLQEAALPIMGKSTQLLDILPQIYFPDTLSSGTVEKNPDFIITSAEVVQGSFFAGSDKCEERSMILCTRGDFVEEETYDLFFLAVDSAGKLAVSDKLLFEGSHGQSSTDLQLSALPLPVKKDCFVMMVFAQTESSEVDLLRDSWIEIFIASGKGFRSLFRLQLEETFIQEFEASRDGDDFQDTASKLQRYKILSSHSNGLHDILVTYTKTENGTVIQEGEDIYRFDGVYYRIAEAESGGKR